MTAKTVPTIYIVTHKVANTVLHVEPFVTKGLADVFAFRLTSEHGGQVEVLKRRIHVKVPKVTKAMRLKIAKRHNDASRGIEKREEQR